MESTTTPTAKPARRRGPGRPFQSGADDRRNKAGRGVGIAEITLQRLNEHALRAYEEAQAADATEYTGPPLADLARRHTAQVVRLWSRVLNDEGLPVKHRLAAADALSSRAWGRPSQEVSIAVSRGPDIQQLSRDALFAALQRAAEREQIALPVLPGTSGHLPPPIDVTPRDVMKHDLTVDGQEQSHGRGGDVSARVAKPGKSEVSARG